jgi:hypothetical protein
LALRLKSGTFSVRAEGDVAKYQDVLKALGFSLSPTHASVHLNISDPILVKKVFGAIVGALGFHNMLAVADPLEVSHG